MLTLIACIATPLFAQLTPISICDALQKVDALDGSVVSVQGYFRFGTELGGLYGHNCPKALVLDGSERAQAFHMTWSMPHDQFSDVVQRLVTENDRKTAIRLTVRARVIARRTNLTGVDGKPARMFGHLGVYPAQIDVLAIQDFSLVELPQAAANMRIER